MTQKHKLTKIEKEFKNRIQEALDKITRAHELKNTGKYPKKVSEYYENQRTIN